MEVKKDIGENSQGPAPRFVIVLDAEDGFIKLGLFRVLKRFNILGRFFFEDLDFFAHLFQQRCQTLLTRVLVFQIFWHLDSPASDYWGLRVAGLGLHPS